ncbi:hypothetical protein ACROYT_G033100 [Oculina patagonica]
MYTISKTHKSFKWCRVSVNTCSCFRSFFRGHDILGGCSQFPVLFTDKKQGKVNWQPHFPDMFLINPGLETNSSQLAKDY